MGVTGLWRLIEPAGKPVPVETLENKVLAVDISIWLHQIVKGYQDAKGAPLPNAHLIGLFQRLCKLLYFRIKPVFVFDGVFPELKKETIAKRQENKAKYNSESERIKRELALLLSKKTAISSLLGKDISPKKGIPSTSNIDDLFKLPALPENNEETESESEEEQNSSGSIIDLHSVDIQSNNFKSLPAKDKYDILIELKETRKMNSWGRLHELPRQSDQFSDFQMQRLLKRRKVQECLEETEKEIGDGSLSLNELESLLNEEGIDTQIEAIPTRRIASNNTTRYLLINNVKKALEEAKIKRTLESISGTSSNSSSNDQVQSIKHETQDAVKSELDQDLEKAIKMSLECMQENNISSASKTDDSWTSIMTDSDYTDGTDSEEEDGFMQPDLTSAKAYIMQYSDFTDKAIDRIVSSKSKLKNKHKNPNVHEIINEINQEKSVIVDNINVSSDEDCLASQETGEVENTTVTENHINTTQASVIYVENSDKIISLDSSFSEASDNSDLIPMMDTRCVKDFIDATKPKQDINQTSLKKFDNSVVVSKYVTEINDACTSSMKVELLSSESSDDEFEEVPNIEKKSSKTVVELTLNIEKSCDEKDDIFADIFTTKNIATYTKENVINKVVASTDTNIDVSWKTNVDCTKEDASKEQVNIEYFSNDTEQSSKIQEASNLNCSFSPIKNITTDIGLGEKNCTSNEITREIVTTEIFSELAKEVSREGNDTISEKSASGPIKNTVTDNNVNEKKSSANKMIREIITTEKLNEMATEVSNEENVLIQEKSRLDRIGRNITEEMTKEAQELLQIFGIPYIVAPMEAEAQCAFLENIRLTDGTITDDSDIWLFGGKTVYKNFFNQKKHVLQFLSDRIERSFNLSREQLVLLALLVGSDYTTGVDGIGPVTAMEILASFPYNKKQSVNETSKQNHYQQILTGLQEFKRWVRTGKRTDNTSLKKKLKNVSLNEEFPSVRVVQAYMEPNVERNDDNFTWGKLDITILRDYTKAKFGWSQNKLDEIINPVMKRMTERKNQKSVQDYFKRKLEFQTLEEHMSKRVRAAVQKLGPENIIGEEIEDPIPSKKTKSDTKSKGKKTKNKLKILPETNIASDNTNPEITVVASLINSKTEADIIIPKTNRYQEIIPQREKDKQCLLQNKMKAIELFRKTKIDRKKKPQKRKVILPKDKAELSESSDSN